VVKEKCNDAVSAAARLVSAATGGRVVALAAGAAIAWGASGCGSSGQGKLATTTELAASTVTSRTTNTTPPQTATATKTVTQPARTNTVTETKTATAPSKTTSITNKTTSVQVVPTTTSGGATGKGVPWWGWLLIVLGGAGIALATFLAGRHRGRRTSADQPEARADRGEGPKT
jgi:hypothetical protein